MSDHDADRRLEHLVEVDLATGWGYQDKLHGGYLLATAVGAALTPDHPHPLAASALYATNPSPGPATVRVRPLRAGRTVATFALTLEQAGRPCVEVLLTAGRLSADVRWDDGAEPMPTLPPRELCLGGEQHETYDPLRTGPMTVRLDPAFSMPPYGPGGAGDIRGWVRCDEPDPLLAALIGADALPPVTFDLGIRGWVPTLQLQVLLRRQPPAGWLVGRQHCTLLAGGTVDEDCTLWDPATGAVVAQARQLAAFRET